MAYQKRQKKEIKLTDLRVRMTPELQKSISKVALLIKESRGSAICERLIKAYEGDQQLIAQLQARNNELHRRLQQYNDREETAQMLIKSMAFRLDGMEKTCKGEKKRLMELATRFTKLSKSPAKKKK